MRKLYHNGFVVKSFEELNSECNNSEYFGVGRFLTWPLDEKKIKHQYVFQRRLLNAGLDIRMEDYGPYQNFTIYNDILTIVKN